MPLISRLYANDALKARRGVGHSKAKAGQRHMHKGERPGAITILRPDADGNLRTAGEPVAAGKRVRWDAAGLYVERS